MMPAKPSWDPSNVQTVDFDTMVRIGNVGGWSSVFKFGFNEAVTGTETVIWTEGGPVPYPDTPQLLTISSTSVNDTSPSGTGARRVQVKVINDLGAEEVLIIPLLGQTPITIPTDKGTVPGFGDFVNSLAVIEAGGTPPYNGNDGDIYIGYGTVTAGRPASVLGRINIQRVGDLSPPNEELQGFFKVPTGREVMFRHFFTSVKRNSDVDVSIYARPPTGPFQIKGIAQAVAGSVAIPVSVGSALPAGTIIESRAVSSGGVSSVSIILQLLQREI